MSDQGARALAAVTRLRVALERIADALARPHLETLLALESEIERALEEVPSTMETFTADECRVVRAEVDAAHHALLRCRRLGAALGSFVRTSLEAQGRTEYGPRGSMPSYAGQALDARV
jgi:hypothetical protein